MVRMRIFLKLLLVLPLSACASEWLRYQGHGENARQHIVLIAGDQEYRSEEAMPQLARILSEKHGFRVSVLFAQHPDSPGIYNPTEPNSIPGLEQLAEANLMVIFARFLTLPDEQMHRIDDYLAAGKPVIGLRTSTHAFRFRKDHAESAWRHYGNKFEGTPSGDWEGGFGRVVLGERWVAHHGNHKHQSTRGIVVDAAHEIVNGIDDGDIWGATDVYRVRLPLPGDSKPLVLGQTVDRAGEYDGDDLFFGMRPTDSVLAETNKRGVRVNEPPMPIAWTRTYQIPDGIRGRAFTSTIGSSTDMLSAGVRRLWVNAVYWALGLPVPEEADVELVGEYAPTQFGFYAPEAWAERRISISGLR